MWSRSFVSAMQSLGDRMCGTDFLLFPDFFCELKKPPMAPPSTTAMKASTQPDNMIHQNGMPQNFVFLFSFQDLFFHRFGVEPRVWLDSICSILVKL